MELRNNCDCNLFYFTKYVQVAELATFSLHHIALLQELGIKLGGTIGRNSESKYGIWDFSVVYWEGNEIGLGWKLNKAGNVSNVSEEELGYKSLGKGHKGTIN